VNKKKLRLLPVCLMLALLAGGCAGTKSADVAEAPPATEAVQKTEQLVYEGEVAGISERAGTISITVGKGEQAKVMMVKFDDKTTGVNKVTKGTAVKVAYELRGNEAFATDVQLKLAKLPPGTSEIKTPELQKMINNKEPLFLVDSRPLIRYNQSHLPGAHSIPVPLLEEKKAEVLPKNKDLPLVFYCGGPT
jgi:hypothetical protein